jgi:hypothetical protein
VETPIDNKPGAPASAQKWMRAFGGFRHLLKETERINRIIKREFGRIEEDMRPSRASIGSRSSPVTFTSAPFAASASSLGSSACSARSAGCTMKPY